MRKRILMKALSAFMAGAMIVSGFHISVKANPINLTIDDVNENQNIVSYTYDFHGEEKTIYVYNNENTNSAKMTGDIVFITGTNDYECPNISGYVEVPFSVKGVSVGCIYETDYYGNRMEKWYTLVLAEDGELYNFNENRRSTETTNPLPSDSTETQWFSFISNIKKIEGLFSLNENGTLFFEDNTTVCNNVMDFSIIDWSSNTVLVTKNNGSYEIYSMSKITNINDNCNMNPLTNFITQIANNKIQINPVNVNSLKIKQNGTVNNISSLTPTINGAIKTYTIGDITITYDVDKFIVTVESNNGNVHYDYTKQAVVSNDSEITFDASQSKELGKHVKINLDKSQIEYLFDKSIAHGHYNAIPSIYWTTMFDTVDVPLSYTMSGKNIGFTINVNQDNYTNYVTVDFENNKVIIEKELLNSGNKTEEIINSAIINNTINLNDNALLNLYSSNLAQLLSMPNNNVEISLSYDPVTDKITVIMDDFGYILSGCTEKNYYTNSYDALSVDSAIIKEATNNNVTISGYNKEFSAMENCDIKIDIAKFYNIEHTYKVGNDTYMLKTDNSLVKVLPCFEENEIVYYTTENVATNVVKASKEGYLTSDGKLYNYNNDLVYDNVINILDGKYITSAGTYNYDNTEFLYNYATEYNVRFNMNSLYSYTVECNDDIVSIVAPNGAQLSDGDTYNTLSGGIYLFEVTNIYGDVFVEKLYVNGTSDSKLEAPIASFINDKLIIVKNPNADANEKIQYTYDFENWYDYNGAELGFTIDETDENYTNPIWFHSINGNATSDVMGAYFEYGEGVIFNATEKMIEANNFCGYGYIDSKGYLYDLDGYQINTNVTTAAIYSPSNMLIYEGTSDFTKIEYESDTLNPFLVLYDGYAQYIVGNSGNVVKKYEDGLIYGSCGIVQSAKWKNEWLGTNFESLSPNGTLTFAEGSIDVLYNSDLDIHAKDLKYYTLEDITAYASGTDLTNVPESTDNIISVRVVEDGFTALADNGNVYIYNAVYNAMIYDDTQIFDSKYKTDFVILNSKWTNQNVNVIIAYGYGIQYENDTSLSIPEDPVRGEYFPVYWFDNYDFIHNINTPSTLTITFKNNNMGSCGLFDVNTSQKITPTTVTDENGNPITLTTSNDMWIKCTYNLDVGTYEYRKLSYDFPIKNEFILNGETHKLTELITIPEDVAPYKVFDMDNNLIPITKSTHQIYSNDWEMNVPNGLYKVNTYNEYDNDKLVLSQYVYIGNIDNVAPSVVAKSIRQNVLNFDAFDNSGNNSAVSGIDKVYYSTNNIDFNEILTTQKIQYLENGQTVENGCIGVNSQYVYMYTQDKAGNKSAIKTFDLFSNDPTISSTPIVDNSITLIPIDGDGNTGDTSKIDKVYISVDNQDFVEIDYEKPIKYDDSIDDIIIDGNIIKIPTKIIYGYTVDVDGKKSDVVPFTVYLDVFPNLDYNKDLTSLDFYANDDISHNNAKFEYEIIENNKSEKIYANEYTDDTIVTIKVTFVDNGVVSTKTKEVPIKVIKTDAPVISYNNVKTIKVDSSKNIQNAKFTTLWISIDGEDYKAYNKETVTFDLEPGSHTIKSYQTVTFTDDNTIVINSEITIKTFMVQENNISDPNTGIYIPVVFWISMGLTTASVVALLLINKK